MVPVGQRSDAVGHIFIDAVAENWVVFYGNEYSAVSTRSTTANVNGIASARLHVIGLTCIAFRTGLEGVLFLRQLLAIFRRHLLACSADETVIMGIPSIFNSCLLTPPSLQKYDPNILKLQPQQLRLAKWEGEF